MMKWAMVVDLSKGVRCCGCVVACRVEHFLPISHDWLRLMAVEPDRNGEKLGYDPLSYFKEPGESRYSTPELTKEYPLILTTGCRQPFYFLSQYRNIPWLKGFQQYPIAQINPETAKNLGIEDGDWMWIESPRGRIKQKARLYPGIDPRVVMATANCYYPE